MSMEMMSIGTSAMGLSGSTAANRMPPPPPPPMTEEEQSTAQSILADFTDTELTEENATAMVEALKEAGIRPGEELSALMAEAGFDAAEVGDLAGVEPPKGGGGMPPPGAGGSNALGSNMTSVEVNQETLSLLQDILKDYPELSSLNEQQQEQLNASLMQAGIIESPESGGTGLPEPGALVNGYY